MSSGFKIEQGIQPRHAPGAVLQAVSGRLFPDARLWFVLAVLMAVNLTWVDLDPRLSLSLRSMANMAGVLAGLLLVLFYRHVRNAEADRMLDIMTRLLMTALFAAVMTQQVNLFSHLGMTLAFPLADLRLNGWDQALGFDWNGYVALVAGPRWLRDTLLFFYSQPIGPALAVIVVVAVVAGRHDRLEELAFLAFASGLLSVSVAAMFPALGAWSVIATQQAKELVGGQPMLLEAQQLQRLRGSGDIVLDLRSMAGVANFLSYHTCLAIIIMWCSRGHWMASAAGCVIGIGILAATPVYGGHYLVDMIGAATVMVALILAWPRLAGRRPEGV